MTCTSLESPKITIKRKCSSISNLEWSRCVTDAWKRRKYRNICCICDGCLHRHIRISLPKSEFCRTVMHNLFKTYTKLSHISSEPAFALKRIKFLSEERGRSNYTHYQYEYTEHAITFLAPTNHETLFSLFKGHLTRTYRRAIVNLTVILMGSAWKIERVQD